MIKVKRGEETIEIEEKDKQDDDELITETQQSKTEEKKLTQSEVNALIAAEKRNWQKKLEKAQSDFDTYKTEIETKEQAEELKLKERVDELSKNYSERELAALDGKTNSEKLQWMEKFQPEKKTDFPITPKGSKEEQPKKQKSIGTII